MNYNELPTNAFEHIARNAGVVLTSFDPKTKEYQASDIIGATTGGLDISEDLEFVDDGEDIDNCPENTKELKRIQGRTLTVSGTFVAVTTALAKRLLAACSVSGNKFTPLHTIDVANDFSDLWWVCPYGPDNGGGFIAVELKDCMNTGGLKINSEKDEKATFDFEFTPHYSFNSPTTVPYNFYLVEGTISG